MEDAKRAAVEHCAALSVAVEKRFGGQYTRIDIAPAKLLHGSTETRKKAAADLLSRWALIQP